MPNSVRLDAETEALPRRLARPSGWTKSDVLRETLLRLSRQHEALEPADWPCVLISDLRRDRPSTDPMTWPEPGMTCT